MMPTLILTPRATDDAQALWRAAIGLGWNVERVTGWRVSDEIRALPDPVLYLEALMGPALAEQFGLTLTEPPDDWLPRLPEEYRKRQIRLGTVGDARRIREPMFVKPPNSKSFPAGVYAATEIPTEFPEETPALIGEVVQWELEFRCFVLDRCVSTLSIYMRNGELQRNTGFRHTPEEEAELREFVDAMLADERVLLPRAAVLDVGVIAGRGWAIVEQNAAWGSGIYGCDPRAVLEVLRFAGDAR